MHNEKINKVFLSDTDIDAILHIFRDYENPGFMDKYLFDAYRKLDPHEDYYEEMPRWLQNMSKQHKKESSI